MSEGFLSRRPGLVESLEGQVHMKSLVLCGLTEGRFDGQTDESMTQHFKRDLKIW